MGLLTDSFFIRALKSNAALLAKLPAHDIYNNVADPDYDMDIVFAVLDKDILEMGKNIQGMSKTGW